MEDESGVRFAGAVDHIAVKCDDIREAASEYQRLGFKVESLFDDWAMLRDSRGFGVALLPPGSKHPPHLALRVETLAELEAAARREGRPVKEHRDRTVSFYTKGVGEQIVELIYYPANYLQETTQETMHENTQEQAAGTAEGAY